MLRDATTLRPTRVNCSKVTDCASPRAVASVQRARQATVVGTPIQASNRVAMQMIHSSFFRVLTRK